MMSEQPPLATKAVSIGASAKRRIISGTQSPRVFIFTGCMAPYYLPVFEHLRVLLPDLHIFVSTPMEPNRDWKPEWGDLPVTVQKCWSYGTYWRHEQGFTERNWRHIPYDTLPLLIRERPDVVVSLQLGFRTMQAAMYRKVFRDNRLIVWTGLSEHTEKGLSSLRILQRKALLGLADAVLVNGRSGEKYLRSLGVSPRRIFPLPYCAKIASHLSLPLKRDARVARRLIYVGQLITRKGLAPFLTTLSDWLGSHPNASCEFWIAGDGPARRELERFSGPSQLRLKLLGSVPYEKLPELYGQGGIFVFPTLADEWGVVVNEALAAGLPVLGSRYSQAVEELIRDGVEGWTFYPDQPEQMSGALDRAMTTTDEKLDEMRRAGRERIRPLAPEYGAKCFLSGIDFVTGSPGESSSREGI
jgi:glycosyltransferase involved in cell wall biosynthesis